ncbi:MAG: GIY-YIG nuclease family protein, partial [Patescibacteria group bacterium]
MEQVFKPELKKVPGSPGVYLMYGKPHPTSPYQGEEKGSSSDKGGRVIYVGKAINLRKRVSSYWKQLNKQSVKTQALIKQVVKLDFIATDTEAEALILENELIKKYQPQYNVLLRDDKTFQYIRVGLDQKYPEINSVRRVNPADIKSRDPLRPRYFGPYTAGGAVKNTLKLLNSIFPLCGKARELNRGSVKAPCLNYHLGRCLGVCVGKANASDYRRAVDEVVKFLGSDTKD